jgi:NAD(P)-dependent dehydrogenase (short-subunit alcohol dehydrogenase family)
MPEITPIVSSDANSQTSQLNNGRLNGMVALVTGAARGIGLAIAQAFVSEGAFVYLSDVNNQIGKAVANDIGKSAVYLSLDVTNETNWQSVIEHITNVHGKLDILINNAGITGFTETEGPHDPENLDMASWQRVMDVNLSGTVLGCKYAIRTMREKGGGSIVNISSRSGMVGIPGASAYAASKAAVRNHTKTVALYCAEQGYKIRCNSVHPAAILTPMWDPMLGNGEARKQALKAIGKDIPMGHIGEPDDVAKAVIYLASDDAKYVTGAELTVDGGILAGSTARPQEVDDI